MCPSCPGTYSVDQTGPQILLLLPPKCWDERRAPPHLADFFWGVQMGVGVQVGVREQLEE